MKTPNRSFTEGRATSDRRTFLFAGLGIAAAPLTGSAQAPTPNPSSERSARSATSVLRSARGRRRLGSLEVANFESSMPRLPR
jgi:hypothetical protein